MIDKLLIFLTALLVASFITLLSTYESLKVYYDVLMLIIGTASMLLSIWQFFRNTNDK